MLSLSIAGIGSAWMGGSARIPFVAGLDSYMPAAMGKVHPKYATPHVALIVQGIVSLVLIVLNFTLSGGVQEAFQKMLSAAVVLQLVPFLYVFAALIKFAVRGSLQGCYGRGTLMFAGVAGLVTTIARDRRGLFPSQTNHVIMEIRSEYVWHHARLYRISGIFLLRIQPSENARSSSCGDRRLARPARKQIRH